MGHRNSSAQLSRHGGVFAAERGTAAFAAAGLKPRASTKTFSAADCEAASHGAKSAPKSIGAHVLMFLVRCYMIFLSPFFGGACKFEPSCSNYAHEALAVHGAWRGTVLALKRLLRCRPFTIGGYDPVPDTRQEEGKTDISGAKTLNGSASRMLERKLRPPTTLIPSGQFGRDCQFVSPIRGKRGPIQ
jgi:putative membrane protein insertion efficiency factor